MSNTSRSERATAGVGGPFPIRFPVGMLAGIAAGIVMLPICWKVGLAFSPSLQVYYLGTYYSSLLASLAPNPRHVVVQSPYRVKMRGEKLAVQESIDRFPESIHEETIPENPTAFHAWLREHIYGGSPSRVIEIPLTSCVLAFGVLLIAGVGLDRRRRQTARKGVHLSGTRMVGWRQFNREVLGNLEAGISLRVGPHGEHVTIPRELEAYHLNLIGSTGMGKTTLLRELATQIQARGDVMVVYDPKQEFYEEFWQGDQDTVFDPTNADCPYWALEEEARDEAESTPWAMAFWPDEPRQQPFFKKHPRAIFAYLISRFNVFNEPGDPATCANLGYWLSNPRVHIAKRLKGTEHAIAVDREAKDQSQGLHTTLGEVAKPLRMMPPTKEGRKSFSVREWSKRRPGNIFFTSTPKTVDALLPLQSAILDMLILENQEPRREGSKLPRIWFLIDEVATLQRLPQIEAAATKQRASGNPIVLGLHDHAQMKKRYGDEGAITIMGQAYTNIIFRTGDPTAAKHCEMMIGHAEVERANENRPTDVLMRHNRGSSMSSQMADTPVVSAATVLGMPRFHGFILHGGRVTSLETQPAPRVIRKERVERIIPPLIFREAPESQSAVEEVGPALLAPVDDLPEGVHAVVVQIDEAGVDNPKRYLRKLALNCKRIADRHAKRGLKAEDFEGPPQTQFICARCLEISSFEGELDVPTSRCLNCNGDFFSLPSGEFVRNTCQAPHVKKRPGKRSGNPLLKRKKKDAAVDRQLPLEGETE